MAGVTYLIRLLPMLFIRKRITNRFVRSFLYYIPYAVLTVMTFPAIIFATENIASGTVALIVCIALAYFGKGLVTVAVGGAASVLLVELIIRYIIPLIA